MKFTMCCRLWLAIAALSCLACSEAPEASRLPATSEALREEITIEVANRAKLAEFLAANRGKVVLVDFWQTSCQPCVEKLPKVIELGKRLQDRGLVVVTLSLDDPDVREDIREFLKGRGAGGQQLISEFGTSPQSLEEFEIDLVPVYRLYDREGELVETFQTGPDMPTIEVDDLESAIEKLL